MFSIDVFKSKKYLVTSCHGPNPVMQIGLPANEKSPKDTV